MKKINIVLLAIMGSGLLVGVTGCDPSEYRNAGEKTHDALDKSRREFKEGYDNFRDGWKQHRN